MRCRIVCIGCLAFLIGGISALAQEAGAVGINFSAGSEIGVGATFHLNDTFVLRPQIRYDHTEQSLCVANMFDGAFCYEASYDAYGVGLGMLFNAFTRDSLTGYGGFDLSYDHLEYGLSPSSWRGGLRGLFGLRYLVARRVGLYGEAGLSWTREKMQSSGEYVDNYGTTTAALGVVSYVK